MKLFGQPVASMYLWAIALLLLLAAYSAYALHQFPYSLSLAAVLAPLVELATLRILHRPMKAPWSGIITGLIIGEVAPINAPMAAIAVACVAAILSKYIIRVKGSNVFNPAAFGMLIGLAIFALEDAWWGAAGIPMQGLALPASIIFVIASYKSGRLVASLSFAATVIVLTVLSGGSASPYSVLVAAFGVNYFFALLMLAEPKTTPYRNRAQAAYGAGIGVAYEALAVLGVSYPYFLALLLGNIAYAAYRKKGQRLWQPGKTAASQSQSG